MKNSILYLSFIPILAGCSLLQKEEPIQPPQKPQIKVIQNATGALSGSEDNGIIVNVAEGGYVIETEKNEPVPIMNTGGVMVTIEDEQGYNVDTRPLTQDEINNLKGNTQ